MATELDNLRRTSARDLHREFQLVLDRVDAALDEIGALIDGIVDTDALADGAVDLDTKITEGTRKIVANMAGFLLRGIFKPDQLNGSPDAGEIDFDPIEAGEDYVTFLPDGSVVEVSNANRSLMSQGAQESYTGRVFIVFSKTPSNTSRGLSAAQDSHILVVRFNSGTYQYDTGSTWASFTPTHTDICIYEVDRAGGGWAGKPTRYIGRELLSHMETRERVDAAIDDLGKLLADTVGSIALQDNAVIARTIAAGAVFAQKLLIGNFFNVIPDPSFEHDTLSDHWRTSASGGTWSRVQSDTATPFHASWMARYDTTGQTANAYMVTSPEGVETNGPGPGYIECREDDVFSVRFRVRMASGGGNPSNAYVRAYLRYYDKDGAIISGEFGPFVQPVTSSWTLVEYLGAGAPAGTGYVNIGAHILNSADSGPRYLFDAFESTRPVGGVYIEDGAITTDKLFANAVTTAKLAAGAITANEIAANAVIATKIIANAIETDKINGLAVTTAKINTNAVTQLNSEFTSNVNYTGNSEQTPESLTFTSDGGVVLVMAFFTATINSGGPSILTSRLKNGTTELQATTHLMTTNGDAIALGYSETPGAGSVTYNLTVQAAVVTADYDIDDITLVVFERQK